MATEPADIRKRAVLRHEDVVALNFIRDTGAYVFRRHHRCGLRSHIMEVLRAAEVAQESRGVIRNGLRRFPAARPLKMLRIFRRRFNDRSQALGEIRRLRILEAFLPVGNLATSSEFLADYDLDGSRELLLCGLQEYVAGEVLDPWAPGDPADPDAFLRSPLELACNAAGRVLPPLEKVRANLARFIDGVHRMTREAGHIPDLAGVRNLLVGADGVIRLVDINNISAVSLNDSIRLDDKGYPVGDKSVEALSLLEIKALGRPPDDRRPLYRCFLRADRMAEVNAIDRRFHLRDPGGCEC